MAARFRDQHRINAVSVVNPALQGRFGLFFFRYSSLHWPLSGDRGLGPSENRAAVYTLHDRPVMCFHQPRSAGVGERVDSS